MNIRQSIWPSWRPDWTSQAFDKRFAIICFPYAGGSSGAWGDWDTPIAPDVSFTPYELPGHGSRMAEALLTDRGALVDQIAKDLQSFLSTTRLVFMGHSMGATLAYEVAVKLNKNIPLILSGRAAPGYSTFSDMDLSDAALTEDLKTHGGTPAEVLKCQEIIDLILPILRADYMLLSSQPEVSVNYDAPTLILGGRDDNGISTKALMSWETLCPKSQTKIFDGGHFFIKTHFEEVKNSIRDWLSEL